MKKVGMVLCLLCAVVMIFNVNCASILDGTSGRRTSNIQWGFVVLDVLFTGVLGLVVDFATGAIYAREEGSRGEIEQQLKEYAMTGKPAYMVRADGYYKVEFVNGSLKEFKMAQNEVPAVVLQAVEKQKTALSIAR